MTTRKSATSTPAQRRKPAASKGKTAPKTKAKATKAASKPKSDSKARVKLAPESQKTENTAQSRPETETESESRRDQFSPISSEDLDRLESVSRTVLKSALKGQKLLSDSMHRSLEGLPPGSTNTDPMHANPEMLQTWENILSDPELLMQAQSDLYAGYLDLWSNATRRLMSGESPDPVIQPEPGDKRWRSAAWSDHPLFDAMKQSYLLNQRFLMGLVDGAKGIDEATKRKVHFVTQQMVDALAPTNFAFTNPDVLEETFKTRGENLTRGLMNLVEDLERGNGRLALSQTDMEGFEVGKDLASTPGEVIYRNRVMELKDPTAHAEILVIREAAAKAGDVRLPGSRLYVTLEPCPMCAGALNWAQLGKIVYGASDDKRGFMNYGKRMLHPKTKLSRGVMEQEDDPARIVSSEEILHSQSSGTSL